MQGLLSFGKAPPGPGGQARGHTALTGARATGNILRPAAPLGSGPQKSAASLSQVRVKAFGGDVEAQPTAFGDHPTHRDETAASPRPSASDPPFLFKFLVPDAVVGAIMGRNGSNVQAIRAQTGAFIQFCRPGSATTSRLERMLILSSPSLDGAAEAVRLLLLGLELQPGGLARLGNRQHSSEAVLRLVLPGVCAGAVMGPGGETIKGVEARTGCGASVEARFPHAAFHPFRAVLLTARSAGALAAGAAEVMALVSRDARYGPGIAALASTAFRVVPVPERRVGALLGPGGAHIRVLQDVLRVKLGVAERSDAAGRKYVSIWGGTENVEVALRAVLLATGQRWSGNIDDPVRAEVGGAVQPSGTWSPARIAESGAMGYTSTDPPALEAFAVEFQHTLSDQVGDADARSHNGTVPAR